MIEFTSNIRQSIAEINAIQNSRLPEALQRAGDDIAAILTQETKNLIPAAHRKAPGQKKLSTATGRLWSSWGVPDEVRTDNPDYDPSDNIHEVRVTRANVIVNVGTKVPYAEYANDGVPRGQGRVAYFFREGGRANAEETCRDVFDKHMNEAMTPIESLAAVRRFNAARQKRSVSGRFGAVLRRGK